MAAPPGKAGLPLLAGHTIVVTRARDQAARLAERLEAFHANVVEYPTILVRPVAFSNDDVPPVSTFDWVVFTSANAVRSFLAGLESLGRATKEFEGVHVCAVGPGTALVLDDAGIAVNLMPEEALGEAVVDAIVAHDHVLTEKRVLFPKGNLARDVVPTRLRALGAQVTECVVYETVEPERDEAAAARLLAARPSVITFTSGSTARNFRGLLDDQRFATLKDFTVFASIGPQTTAAAKEAGIPIAIEAARHDLDGLVDAIVMWAQGGVEPPEKNEEHS